MQNKTIALIVTCISLPVIYFFTGPVIIELSNKTGHDLEAISIANKSPFNLAKGESRKLLFGSFSFDSGLPDENIEALVLGKKLSNEDRNYDCGTQKYNRSWGYYTINIECDTIDYQACLELTQP